MEKQILLERLQDYLAWAHLWHKLEPDHSSDSLNYLMLRVVETEEELLTAFGLPFTFKYSELFQMLALQEKIVLSDLEEFLIQMGNEATTYLTGPVTTDISLLKNAFQLRMDVDEVLPELSLKLRPEPYYLYLYEQHFMTGLLRAEDFLEELTIIGLNDLSLKLNLLSQHPGLFEQDEYQELTQYNLKYLEAFRKYIES